MFKGYRIGMFLERGEEDGAVVDNLDLLKMLLPANFLK